MEMTPKERLKAGPELWKKAKRIIPGGNQLLSKRAEIFLPGRWPSYYQKAKGVEVWDLDGNKYIDMSIMGVGSCILGYADDDVNEAVKKAVDKGSMCTLNAPEEVELAELLLELHPWAGMVRFTRTGGEAMAVAVRIARAYTRKDKIAFCGYHGWHDWYLSANLGDKKNLDGHLLPGLRPLGVPRILKGTALPFTYNKIEELQNIVKKHDIGTVVMEPMRSSYPEGNFLEKAREISTRIKAVLIFDEITVGFRMNIGGMHQLLRAEPDLVVYAKGISNGFPMGAVIGKRRIMNLAQESFISSTYWTERIGPVAALVTIKKMREKDVPSHLIKIGNSITEGWKGLAAKHGLKIKTTGIPPLTTFSFDYGKESQSLHTLFTQEMLKRGFLASKSVYVSYAHQEKHVEKYLEKADDVFGIIKEALKRRKVRALLEGPVAQTGFKRVA